MVIGVAFRAMRAQTCVHNGGLAVHVRPLEPATASMELLHIAFPDDASSHVVNNRQAERGACAELTLCLDGREMLQELARFLAVMTAA